jgi:hypothetical protein
MVSEAVCKTATGLTDVLFVTATAGDEIDKISRAAGDVGLDFKETR